MIEFWKTRSKESAKFSSNELPTKNEVQTSSENFPINLMARQFCSWFFENLNAKSLKINDLWVDCLLNVRIVAAGLGVKEKETKGNKACFEMLSYLKRELSISFNPSLCHEGVQGRTDPHGLVIVMCCGTVHSQTQCVGLFESAFGIMRDPYSENNWRIRHLNLKIKSSTTKTMPKLRECDTIEHILLLPETSDVI